MINILIVEDGKDETAFYKNALKDLDELNCLFVDSAEKALVSINETYIDLFILDVELPGINGFDLANRIRHIDIYVLTPILFVTGYENYQLEAFKQFHCYDYIIKPFNQRGLTSKILELSKLIGNKTTACHRHKLISYPQPRKSMLIPTDQIRYAEIQRGICYLYTGLQEPPFTTRHFTLTELLEEVDEKFFLRCHKSFAVNVKNISSIVDVSYRNWHIILQQENQTISMSKKYYVQVMSQFDLWIKEQKQR